MAKSKQPRSESVSSKLHFYPIILAGGRGTRFWPLSRIKKAKQLLPLNSDKSMIQETVERLVPIARPKQFWVITNEDLYTPIAKELKNLPKKQIIAEPIGRNTAPAIGLAAFLLLGRDPDAVLGLFPSDHVILDEKQFQSDIQRAAEIAAAGENIVVLGIQPTRPETGYGYIEAGKKNQDGVLQVRRFTEKPNGGCRRDVRESRELFLEQRHVCVERSHVGQRVTGASSEDRGAAGRNRRQLRHAQVCQDPGPALSAGRKHQR